MRHAASHARCTSVYISHVRVRQKERERTCVCVCVYTCVEPVEKKERVGEQAEVEKKERKMNHVAALWPSGVTYFAYMSELPKDPLVRAMNGFSGARCKQMLLSTSARAEKSR